MNSVYLSISSCAVFYTDLILLMIWMTIGIHTLVRQLENEKSLPQEEFIWIDEPEQNKHNIPFIYEYDAFTLLFAFSFDPSWDLCVFFLFLYFRFSHTQTLTNTQ